MSDSLVQGAIRAVYNNIKKFEECFANEINGAANNDNKASVEILWKEEFERIAISVR